MFAYELSNPDRQRFMQECQAYSIGSWTKTAPTIPGTYNTMTTHGALGPSIELRMWNNQLVQYKSGEYIAAEKAWRGFWWSCPIPNLPTPVSTNGA